MEWLSILIPVVAAGVLHFGYRKHVTWWECVLPMIPVFIIVPLVRAGAETSQTIDHERRGGWVATAEYFEDWDEWISETCSYTVSCGKDCTQTVYYDCSYRRYHPPIWQVTDSNGYVVPIASEDFESICKKFGNRKFVEMHRRYYTKDGDKYESTFNGKYEAIVPVTTLHRYENRVQATDGVFAYDPVDNPKEKGLYEWPKLTDNLRDPAILGQAPDVPEVGNVTLQANQILEKENARIGRSKQVRMWVLLFHDKPHSTGLDQEAYWKGGNKNEVVVCVGFKGESVEWVHPFCWSPDGNASNDEMKSLIRSHLIAMHPFDLRLAVDKVVSHVETKFVRKPFKEFSYLSVKTPAWAVVMIYAFVTLSTVGISVWAVLNEFDESNVQSKAFNREPQRNPIQ